MRGTWQTTDGGGRGGLVLAVIAAGVLIGSGTVSATASALAGLLMTILIVLGSIIGLAVIAGIAWLVYRARQDRPVPPIAAPPVPLPLPSEVRPHLDGSARPAIGPGREVHFHLNVTPDQLAAILRHHTEEDQ